ncbi:MAG: hypothetical protein U1F58_07925 [Burkholderiales bacterium]
MPHVDGLSLPGTPLAARESPFAQPVAAVTALVARAFRSRRIPSEVRDVEAAHARAADHGDLERIQRDWDRRDGGGVRSWEWR